MKIRYILLLVLGGALLVGCTQSKLVSRNKSDATPWKISLLVTGNGSGASMKINTGSMHGCTNSKAGCMTFKKSETGKIRFDISGNDSGFNITELKICMGPTEPSPLSKDCVLPDVNALDFYVKDSNGALRPPNTKSGKIEWKYTDAVKEFVLYDRNLLKQEYYYLLVACDGPDPAVDNCLLADPIMDNKGFF
jgi:hypothetical protein